MTASSSPPLDPLHSQSAPDLLWTTVNTAEAIPGVLTPLGWTFLRDGFERAFRRAFFDLGILSRREANLADPATDQPTENPFEHRSNTVFYGRFALNVSVLRAVADRLPGTSGDALEEQMFGGVSPEGVSAPSRRRYPILALRFPVALATMPKKMRRLRTEQHAWWQQTTGTSPRDLDAARQALVVALDRNRHAWHIHSIARLPTQGLYEQLAVMAKRAGQPGLELQLTTGYGNVEETRVNIDLWEVSRGRLSWEAFLGRHGFLGPGGGEISSRSWREESEPVRALAAIYAAMDDREHPEEAARRQAAERVATEAKLLAGLGRKDAELAKVLLSIARRNIPLQEISKAAVTQAVDGGRAIARSAGALLARDGIIDDPEDVFYLTVDELLSYLPVDVRERIALRRERRAHYLTLQLPERWTGQPEPIPCQVGDLPDQDEIIAIGASPGVVVGRARVLLDAADVHTLEEGEILVCEITDPSWAPVFVVALAIVVDIGAALSHAAIVAREMGVPCVINTRVGTRVIRTGDTLRVDGSQGTVTILDRSREDAR